MSGDQIGPGTHDGARARILRRVREAVGTRERTPHPGGLPPGHAAGGIDPFERFREVLERSGGEVLRFEDVPSARAWLTSFAVGLDGVAAGPDVPDFLVPAIPPAPPRSAALGVSLALAASASTGSLLLTSREGRSLQLLPPVHLIWLDPSTIHPDLDSALRSVGGEDLPATLGLHSGPSKSADIGRVLVTGVHGPGRLVAAVVPLPGVRP